ncbi:MAG: PKD domain-containing protein [Bacteroidales bacterium]|nr:PKD domain-containing protein [Bacteroidales bacterium]
MRNKIIILVLGLLLSVGSKSLIAGGTSCTADFNYTIDTDISYFTYLFYSTSSTTSSIVKYKWNFGDSIESIKENPEHQFLEEGIYIVTLSIECSDGTSDSYTDTISVEKVVPFSCMANFTAIIDTLQADYTYQFTDHSVSPGDTIISWTWDFGDNTPLNYSQHPQHNYSNPGNYIAVLIIGTSQSCSSMYSDTIKVSSILPSCNADFSFSADSVTGNQELIFFFDQSSSADSIISYHWDFADGDSSISQNPVHIFPNQGVYDVKLSIKTVGGCKSSMHYPIQVGNPQKYNMWGRVYVGNLTTDKCIALLYKEFNNGYIVPIDTVRLTSVNDTLGVYYFYQVLEGMHKVKVILPESSDYDKFYAPTYYGDNLFWNTTSSMNLNTDLSLMNINMSPIIQQTGNCQLNGSVMQNNSSVSQVGVQVLLLNSIFEVYDYTFTDGLGNYTFDDVPQGNYHVYAEVTGLYPIPAQIVFNAITDTINNVNVYLSKTNSMVSIDKALEQKNMVTMSLYPNPVENNLNIRITGNKSRMLGYRIFNNMGQLIREGNVKSAGQITTLNINELHSGLYLLKIISNNEEFTLVKKFIRK